MEHRWGERVQVDFPVRVTTHRFSVREGRLGDMSVSGALLQADIDVRLLSRIQVIIDLPLHPRYQSPVIEAYVARKYKHGLGIEWCQFAPVPVGELLRAVALRPHTRARRHAVSASLTIARLSTPLLKHATIASPGPEEHEHDRT